MKILATIGPETIKSENLKYILKNTNFVRLNSSHNSINWHKSAIKSIRKFNPYSLILVDFPGVKPRTQNKESIKVNKNEIIAFAFNKRVKGKCIQLTRPLPKLFKKSLFSLDDGKIIFKTVKFEKNIIFGKALNDCVIKPRKGLNIPGSIYNDKMQEKIYFKYFEMFKTAKINAVGLSFVQNKNVIEKIKKKFPNILLVSKIENSEGLKNAEEISKFSDAIMIDRGDLSAEIGDHKLYDAIIRISHFSKMFGKPLIMATENLETMYKTNHPSKNDIISLGFAKQINSDIIMLSEETAISKNWKKIILWLNKFLNKNIPKIKSNHSNHIFWQTVDTIRDYPLVVFTKKGLMLDKIFRKNIRNSVYIFTDTLKTLAVSSLYKNANCFLTTKFDNKNINKFYYKYIKQYKKYIFKNNHQAFLITISFPKKGATANTLSLINKKDI